MKLHFGFVFPTDDYRCTITRNDIQNGEFNKRIQDKVRVFGYLEDGEGALSFTLTDSNKFVKITGHFTKGLDTLKSQALMIDPITDKGHIYITKYFEPLADGWWTYLNWKTGKTERVECYRGLPIGMKED